MRCISATTPGMLPIAFFVVLFVSGLSGCRLPGKPRADSTPKRPDQVTDFHTLYRQNCAACHGNNGVGGAAIGLANPSYVAYAEESSIETATANGVPGSLMPAFVQSAGGLLTEQQVSILARGIVQWASPQQLATLHPPPDHTAAIGNVTSGAVLYQTDCIHCHAPGRGSILDPVYLRLITDGGLRALIVAGRQNAMPDWRNYPAGPLTDQQITDLVSFLASHRALATYTATITERQ